MSKNRFLDRSSRSRDPSLGAQQIMNKHKSKRLGYFRLEISRHKLQTTFRSILSNCEDSITFSRMSLSTCKPRSVDEVNFSGSPIIERTISFVAPESFARWRQRRVTLVSHAFWCRGRLGLWPPLGKSSWQHHGICRKGQL